MSEAAESKSSMKLSRPCYRTAMGLVIALASLFAIDLAQPNTVQAASTAWSTTPKPSGLDTLYGVSCVSSTKCIAVGSAARQGGIQRTLVETWNGIKWSITPSPNQGSGVNTLYGVSCVGPTDCVAVGSDYPSPTTDQTLVESWSGRAWAITPSPNEGSADNLLLGVSCTRATNCVAVGDYVNSSNVQQTLVESWNGTAWSITPSPDQGSSSNDLNAVSCAGPTSCVAVGDYASNPIPTLNLVETWNGTAWSITPSPDQGGAVNGLFGVWCTTANNCLAVGFSKPAVPVLSESVSQNLVETWNGTSWSITPSPNQGSGNNDLYGLACSSSSNCVAVGLYVIPTGFVPQNLVETWNGTSWSITPSPNLSGGNSGLSSVSCSSSTNCIAVGKTQILINHKLRRGSKPRSG